MDNSKLKTIIEAIIAMFIVAICGGAEGYVLIHGAPGGLDGVVVGRVLGTLDAVLLIVVNYWFGSSRDTRQQVEAITRIGEAAAQTPINFTMPDGTTVAQTTVAAEAAKAASHM